MIEPPFPASESERLRALCELRILDTPTEERFDRITRIAADLFRVPIALISLVDSDRQWFKSRVGLDATQTPRNISFCGHAILGDGSLVVEDALNDVRFMDNPLVTGPPHIRFYAGMPLHAIGGWRLGTLCLIDSAPRNFTIDDVRRLVDLSAWAERELNSAVELDSAIAEMRDTFVRLVSHELRTPMTGLIGAIDMIRSGVADGQDVLALAGIANDCANRLNRIVGEIVELAEFDAGHWDLAPSSIELPTLIESAIDSTAEFARKHRVELQRNLNGPQFISASPRAVARILRSLLHNALHYAPAGSSVVIATQSIGNGWLRIGVTDAGPGIAVDYLPRLFMPFAQADASDSRMRDGCGMSLAISRRLATAMGGRLGYEPREGGGSHFYLDLRPEGESSCSGTSGPSG